MTQDAVIRNFEIMGEAAKRVSQDLRDKHPDIPWHRIAGFRDVLIHDYIRVDLDEVWNTLAGCGKTLRSPFDELRANGGALEIIDDFPFMLRLSKHENHFFRSPLDFGVV